MYEWKVGSPPPDKNHSNSDWSWGFIGGQPFKILAFLRDLVEENGRAGEFLRHFPYGMGETKYIDISIAGRIFENEVKVIAENGAIYARENKLYNKTISFKDWEGYEASYL